MERTVHDSRPRASKNPQQAVECGKSVYVRIENLYNPSSGTEIDRDEESARFVQEHTEIARQSRRTFEYEKAENAREEQSMIRLIIHIYLSLQHDCGKGSDRLISSYSSTKLVKTSTGR